jgi:DNA (cytosine-5)-methyltransferase 1
VDSGNALHAFSLFTGAGGLDLGVEAAGYNVVFAIENDPVAVETLNLNRERFFPSLPEVDPLDITQLDPKAVMDEAGIEKGEIDLLVGGPPCVAFSKSGFHLDYKRQGRDPKAGLLGDYLRFLETIRPKAYLMENVFGLAYRNQSAPFFNALVDGIRALGYSVTYEVLNAADYGVPQNRQRLFVIGSRDGKDLDLPAPTHWGEHERRRPPDHVDDLLPHVTAREALRGLRTRPEPTEEVNGKYGHLLCEIPPGCNYLHFTDRQGHPEPLFKWRSRYWTFLLKLDPDRPASTIQGQPGPYVGPFHWKDRRLRVPELKRLQGFPDDFKLVGNRRDIQLQIGNSVPPLLVERVAEAIRDQLASGEVGGVDPGQQLSSAA